jgi:AcrR family transcriptional regulator
MPPASDILGRAVALPVTSGAPRDGAAAPSDGTTRDRLLLAAYELLVARGYQATTVQAVAQRAGLTTGAIYANFGGKQELMAHAVLDQWYRSERAALDDFLRDPGPEGPDTAGSIPGASPDALTQLLAGHVAAPAADDHRLLTEVTGAIVREDLRESPLLVSVKFIEEITRASVEAGKAQGRISADLSTDALVAVNVNVYLGAITSKSLGLPQPDFVDTLRVLQAAASGYAAPSPAGG